MQHWLDFGFAALFALVWPWWAAAHGYPRMLRKLQNGEPGARLGGYRTTLLEQWPLAIAAIALWLMPGRSLTALGLSVPHLWRLSVAAVVAVALVVWLASQRRRLAQRPEALARVRGRLGAATPLLPHTAGEFRWFMALSVTAGICEEILFRGFLTALLTSFIGAWPAVLVTIVLFGVAHLYLGRDGAVRATLAGAVMSLICVATGSLWVAMFLHAAVDMHSGSTGYMVLREPPAPRPHGDVELPVALSA